MPDPHLTPALAAGMHRVTSAEFFATVGQRDVHPTPVSLWNTWTGYVCAWRDVGSGGSGALRGVSDGGTHRCTSRYWKPS